MGLEAATFLNDLAPANPLGTDGKSAGDNHIRLMKAVLQNTLPGMAGRAWRYQSKGSNYTIILTDNMTLLYATAGITFSMDPIATIGNGFIAAVVNGHNSANVTLDPDSAETINGGATYTIYPGEAALLFCTSSDWVALRLNLASVWAHYSIKPAAKGDLLAGTGVNTAQLLSAGANGNVLMMDSSETPGMKWTSDYIYAVSTVKGTRANNNSSTPTTQWDMSANEVMLTDTNGIGYLVKATGTLTNNISTAGPAANGRDQSGAFTDPSWLYFYWIYNPTTDTLATISSESPPATGPTLPSGYTAWAFSSTVRYSSSALAVMLQYGAKMHYVGQTTFASGLNATSETDVYNSAVVPAIAQDYDLGAYSLHQNSALSNNAIRYYVVSGTIYIHQQIFSNTSDARYSDFAHIMLPNTGYLGYLWENKASTQTTTLYITSFKLANGDS